MAFHPTRRFEPLLTIDFLISTFKYAFKGCFYIYIGIYILYIKVIKWGIKVY